MSLTSCPQPPGENGACSITAYYRKRAGRRKSNNCKVFQVIIGTVAVYGLTASHVARKLKVAKPDPQGVLFAGSQSWARSIASILKAEGYHVVLVDSNWANVTAARKAGLSAYYANVLSEELLYDIQLDDIGRLLALTPNDEVNSLAALHFVDIFGRSEV